MCIRDRPKVVGLDCVFDVEGDDIEGNDAIIQVAEKYKNIVFAEKKMCIRDRYMKAYVRIIVSNRTLW